MARTTIRTEDITASEVTTAKMAVDPTNASNLSSGSVPTAQLGNVDTTGLETDIALLGFKVAANGSLAAYNLHDQTVDDFQDASGIDASASTNETRNSADYYSGGTTGTVTGGTITTHGVYKVHTFTGSGTFTTNVAGTADILLVAGGGGSGGAHAGGGAGGGGGGGGVRALSSQSISAAGHTVTVGAAGVAGTTFGAAGGTGGSSSLASLSSSGGGGGGYGTNDTGTSIAGTNGASGGGGGYGTSGGPSLSGGTGNSGGYSPVEGYAGGASGGVNTGAGSGGGAAAVGVAPAGASLGTVGGAGAGNDWRTGSTQYYGGGGGGAGFNTGTSFAGGTGGGGASGAIGGYVGTAGTVNTGGGGGGSHGGGGDHRTGAAGGTGIVVVRYNATTAFVSYSDMTLISNATTAQATPTTGDVVMTYTNGAGTATINTDLKAWISRDNGSTYTQATLTSQGTTGGHTILTAHNVDISSQPSGTSMRYKITTHNQSASKETRIQAVSLGWS